MNIPRWYWGLPVQLSTSETLCLVERHPRNGVWPEQSEATGVSVLMGYLGRFAGCATRLTHGKMQRASNRQMCRDRRLR